MTSKQLIEYAEKAREKAYCPYSGFAVGAALVTKSGKVYTGCNVENAGFTPTCCAERVAIFKAVSEGERELEAIAVVGGRVLGDTSAPCYPCGVCRQVLSEFADGQFKVIFADGSEKTVDELLPFSFALDKN